MNYDQEFLDKQELDAWCTKYMEDLHELWCKKYLRFKVTGDDMPQDFKNVLYQKILSERKREQARQVAEEEEQKKSIFDLRRIHLGSSR